MRGGLAGTFDCKSSYFTFFFSKTSVRTATTLKQPTVMSNMDTKWVGFIHVGTRSNWREFEIETNYNLHKYHEYIDRYKATYPAVKPHWLAIQALKQIRKQTRRNRILRSIIVSIWCRPKLEMGVSVRFTDYMDRVDCNKCYRCQHKDILSPGKTRNKLN